MLAYHSGALGVDPAQPPTGVGRAAKHAKRGFRREIRRVDELFRPYLPQAYAERLRVAGGLPALAEELGVTGAAVATNIGRGTGVLYAFTRLIRPGGRIDITRTLVKLEPAIMARLIRLFVRTNFSPSSWTAPLVCRLDARLSYCCAVMALRARSRMALRP